ncbi:MAG: HWE histidine kinase domain-containing protein [Pseudomonadota bacterium]
MNRIPTPDELTQCDREPIHQIAAVQPFGGLIKVNSDWSIGHRSANCAKLLGLKEAPVIGANLASVFRPEAMQSLRSSLVRLASGAELDRLFGVELVEGGGLFDCAIHAVGQRVILEFEPHDEREFVNHIALISPIVAQLESVTDIGTLCTKAASLVRQTLGYDRVMVYKFHDDESGEVVAEDARSDLEPYLGLRYPRGDIPQQARELLIRNRVRVIADVEAPSAAIEPGVAFGNRPLDMSMSVLRAHSMMHLRYLRNMGARATLTVSILRQGKLWGLISCHHMEPRLPSFSLRTVAETLGQMLSLILDRILINRSERLRSRGGDVHNQLMVNLAQGAPLGDNVAMVGEMLDGLIAHDGLTVHLGGQFTRCGSAPSEEEYKAIAATFGALPIDRGFGTANLAHQLPQAAAFKERAAGALMIPISRSPEDFLVLWRKPLSRTVRWAGDPAKAKAVDPEDRLQPRASFAAWEEALEGQSEAWSEDDLHIADGLRVTLLEVIMRMSEEVARERNRAREQQELLIAELNHRVRNILNLIRSLVAQSRHDAIDVESFATIIGGRITALACAHDNITQENWAPAPLAKLFETEIEAYLTEQLDRFSLTGERVLIAPEAYTVLALVVHELMTNSAKYGSLCDRSGTVRVDVGRNARGDLTIAWRECGGPPVQPPTRRGFGSTIIERSIPFELKGEAHVRFHLTGLEADFVVPGRFVSRDTSAVVPGAGAAEIAQPRPNEVRDGVSGQANLTHMLVVEDSMIIAVDVEENLRRLGVASIDVASSVSGALKAIEMQAPDLAMVDFNLGAESSEPVIKELADRGIPFVLATGYGELGEKLGEFGAMGLLRKPYGRAEIENVLNAHKAMLEASMAISARASA